MECTKYERKTGTDADSHQLGQNKSDDDGAFSTTSK